MPIVLYPNDGDNFTPHTADNRKLAAKEDAIQRVIRAMKECSGSASVQEAACKAIINLTAKNSEFDTTTSRFLTVI